MNCCTQENPCDLGEGDCDHDSECTGSLICGSNNCGSGWSNAEFDCCREGKNT